MDPFVRFYNADVLVEREQGNRTATGYQKTGTTTVLDCRGDAQETGYLLQRQDTGDVVVFCEDEVTAVEPEDAVTLDFDDGRTVEGSVDSIEPLHNVLVVET